MRERMVVELQARARAALVVGSALLLASCLTGTPGTEEDLTPAEYFQNAQEAAARHDYRLGLRWYDAFRERFADDPSPEQTTRMLWAEYETAFLYHKMGDDETALRLLGELVRRYEQPEAAGYAAGPRILALRVIDELQPVEPVEQQDAGAQ